jgi:hypothetical protein
MNGGKTPIISLLSAWKGSIAAKFELFAETWDKIQNSA